MLNFLLLVVRHHFAHFTLVREERARTATSAQQMRIRGGLLVAAGKFRRQGIVHKFPKSLEAKTDTSARVE